MTVGQSRRVRVLESCGAPPSLIDELLAYGEQPCQPRQPVPEFPLTDEHHISAWQRYAREGQSGPPFAALQRHLVQLRFPVREGMSGDEAYRQATRQGRIDAAPPVASGLEPHAPDSIAVHVVPTIAGHVPIIVAGNRQDFELLVQALASRNEPVPVPRAMGACLVKGLNNWSRVADYRAEWERQHPGGDWTIGFAELAAQKPLYQDRFIVLSTGPYSNLSPDDAGFDEPAWQRASLAIRREHELTHYFVYRVFGVMRTHVFDEIVADFIGIGRAFGEYRSDLALRCLGLEHFPAYRPGGRLEMYYADVSLSPGAIEVVRTLVYRSVMRLAEMSAAWPPERWADLGYIARLTYALSLLTLEELASDELRSLVSVPSVDNPGL
jgi:hypothetical protein